MTKTPLAAPVSTPYLGVLLIEAEPVNLEVVRGSHFHLHRGTTPKEAMVGPSQQLRLQSNSVLVDDAFLVRRVPEAIHEVESIWYDVLLCRGDGHCLDFRTAAPGSGPLGDPDGQKSTQQCGAGGDGNCGDNCGGGNSGGGGGGAVPAEAPPFNDKPVWPSPHR